MIQQTHYNSDYTCAYTDVKWIRKEIAKYGYQKEIWAGDAASVPWVTERKYIDILKILTNPLNPRYQEIINWFRAEQSKLSVKKFIVAAELNIKKVFLESIKDFPKDAYKNATKESWFLAGFFNKDKTPRPIFYAYAQLVKKIGNFQKIECLSKNGIYFYKVYFPDKKPAYVAWTEKKSQKITLNVGGAYIRLEKVITTNKPVINIKKIKVKRNKVTFSIDDTPVFIEIVD